jgi:hypothetical protein
MSETASQPPPTRRGRDLLRYGEESYVGSASLGYGPDAKRIRRKVFGKTEQEVRDKLKARPARRSLPRR